jgi:aarF domain-containing kinase
LGEDKLKKLGISGGTTTFNSFGWISKMKLLLLYYRAQKSIDLLVDVQGYQMLHVGVFQGDPHPGNVLTLKNGQLGLIDYGQTKSITSEERMGISRIILALGTGASDAVISNAMRELGFETKFNSDTILAKYAAIFFDSDIEGKKTGCATPQEYFKALTIADPLVQVPDVAGKVGSKCMYPFLFVEKHFSDVVSSIPLLVFVARSSFILRGMGTLLDKQIQTSMRWKVFAAQALESE